MKRIILIVGIVALAACSKNEPPDLSPTTPTPRKVVKQRPRPTPDPLVTAEATPAPKRYAPAGIYYLRVARRVETEHGIVGIKRGTEVCVQANGTFKTLDGQVLELASAQITNDLDEVQEILRQEHASEAGLANWRLQNARAEQANQQVQAATPIIQERVVVVHQSPYSPTPQPRNPLERRAYEEKRGVTRAPTYRWMY